MNLVEVFSNPFDPDRSIQLNNKYWPNIKFSLLNLIEDCEGELTRGVAYYNSSSFKKLRAELKSDTYYFNMLRRLGKLRAFNSDYGYTRANFPIGDGLISASQNLNNSETVVRRMPKTTDLMSLEESVKKIYLSEFGWDLARVHKSIRYATPNEVTKKLVSDYGPLSEFHNDELKGITCVVYLSEVKHENGAFSFIDGSDRIPRSFVLTAIHQTVCFDMRISGWEHMSSLPLEFRCTPTIGNFINTEKVARLLKNLVVIEGGPGESIIFNGQKLIHRGGMPTKGFRCAAFLATEGIFVHKIKSLISQYSFKLNI